ncbi:bifunctional DNA-formamidopyrimidine glycosylase/DNA-(apurinic or apyrimidinic site) lyase [Vibrio metschnikovii]|uniref:bifunctional DNA-formamidopyrimidine glycosylase/DNA-(apurinic or apyrimidinic site) lyase n=1 Tax=Vibrio metschnikovii TaxID=28172 RepID=UPI001C30CCCE|nr:bifunctional DNA-formamidopyrimidine glycosylase/DNA-(apurinic or apyrimidinic site) lyase [Vibrio metschnikovii]
MPELPEVEVSRLGISPHLVGQTIAAVTWRCEKLRWPIPHQLIQLEGQKIAAISRRAKYLFIETKAGSAIIHLGMSGALRVLDADFPPGKHDHVDLVLANGKLLRYHDPRRFGAWLYIAPGESHPLLEHMGPEPLTDAFNAETIAKRANNKRLAIKAFIMGNKNVVGVGNIYANESLFKAKIHPLRPAQSLSDIEWQCLVSEIKAVLATAIVQGGTTLKDFSQADGKPGYFAQELQVYGKGGKPCPICAEPIAEQKIAQRNTFFCDACQR